MAQNMSVEPNMTMDPTQQMSMANQTIAPPNQTPMQPNMSTPQGDRFAPPPSVTPKAPAPVTPAKSTATAPAEQPAQTTVATPTQTSEPSRFVNAANELRTALGRDPLGAEVNAFIATGQMPEKQMEKTAPTVAETTSKTNPDGSSTTQTKDFSTPEAQEYKKQLDDSLASIDTEITYARSKFEGLMATADAGQRALMESIQKTFEVRKYEMERINTAALNTQQLLGARSGRQRYAPEMQSSILSEEERAGLVRMTEIEALELQTIAAAQQAATEQDFLLLNGMLNTFQGLRGERNELMQEMYNLSVQEEQRAQTRAKFVLGMQQYENEIVRYEMENEMMYANTVASSLVQFDEMLNITPPTAQQVQDEAERLGIDPNVLNQAVFNQIRTINEMGADEYGTYFENQQFMAQQAQRDFDNFMSTQRYNLEQQLFGLDAAKNGFIFDDTGMLVNIETNELAGVDDWAKQIASGKLKMSDVPSDMKTAVASALNTLPPDPKEIQKLQSKVDEVDALLNDKGLNDAVGSSFFARSATTGLGATLKGAATGAVVAGPLGAIAGGVIGVNNRNQARAFVGKVNSLLGEEVLNKLISSKAEGATFGALSEGELAILQVAASPIRQYGKDVDGDGMIDYFDIDEKTFKQELQKIKSEYERLLDDGKKELQNTPFTGFQDFNSRATPYDKELYKQFDQDPAFQNATTEQIIEAVNQARSFNQPLSTGKKGSDVSTIKDFTRVSTSVGTGTATGIQSGSSLWKYGFDFVLDGGKGAPVRQPFSGRVVEAGTAGGFGKSVVVELPDGTRIRSSHLNDIRVKPGQAVNSRTILGGQGNTGSTLGKTGIHVDYTMYKPDGSLYTSQEVASFFNTKALA